MFWAKILREAITRQNGYLISPSSKRAKKASPWPSKKYRLGEKFSDTYFTQRQADCMLHLIKGQTIKSIADTLKLSPRTIESYIREMKKKVGCKTRSELVGTVLESDFLKDFVLAP
jgi:DNA-binding CsgD family transcriptional regulator